MVMFFVALAVVLVVGDFGSTFFYHVPQHIWGKLHLRTHHDRNRSYWDHAVLSRDPAVMLDGFLGALPYIVLAALLCRISLWSAAGAVIGLLLGQAHVWWRHTSEIGWKSPEWLLRFARVTQIVLPEDHNRHHVDPDLEFGDLFRFYDAPARALLSAVRSFRRRRRSALQRLERLRASRLMRRQAQRA